MRAHGALDPRDKPEDDGVAGAGNGGQEVVARHVGEAAEVDGVGELGLAGGEVLVAAGGDGEGVARRDGVGHRLP